MSDQLISHVRRNRWRSQPGEVAAKDSNYFCFGFDGDYAYDPEGRLYAWCAVGSRCSPELTNAIAKYEKPDWSAAPFLMSTGSKQM